MSRELTRIILELIFPLGHKDFLNYFYCPGSGALLTKVTTVTFDVTGQIRQNTTSIWQQILLVPITVEWLTKEHALLFEEEALPFYPSMPQKQWNDLTFNSTNPDTQPRQEWQPPTTAKLTLPTEPVDCWIALLIADCPSHLGIWTLSPCSSYLLVSSCPQNRWTVTERSTL